MLSIIKKSGYLCKKFHDMLEKIQALLAEIDTLEAHSAEDIEALRIKYLSKKGSIPALMADFRNVPAEQKKEVGVKIIF